MLEKSGLRLFLDSLPDAVLLCGSDGFVHDCNRQCEALLGYAPEELTGLPVEVLIPGDLQQDHIGFRMAYMLAPKPRSMTRLQEIQALRKDGCLQPVTIALSPLALADEQMVIVSIRDNSEAVAARLRERQAFERSLEAQRLESLGLLSCGIAHDFKNLLSVVLGNAELALLEMHDEHPQRNYLQAIQASATHLQEISRQILSYAVGKGVEQQTVDLNEAVTEMKGLLQVALPPSTRIACELAAVQPRLLADPGQISQILLNLILNASEAIGERGGCITIRTGVADSHIYVEVVDDGCGIAETARARILDPFFTTKAGGKGLGLSVVNGIVKNHGGVLTIASGPDAGSTFRVGFPLALQG